MGTSGRGTQARGGYRVRPVRELMPDRGRAAGLLRPEPPFLIASTLLVPGYIDARKQAEECFEAARQAGLKHVRVGNLHLLGLA